ncbi:BTB domain-containing protein [Mycena venus]|uniref:BTB domain-containing protein n=1 Tax=Mycena venus TaxID=2733690 RepID=A0A8H7CZR3_9AGAR|nr:BTB domain-containing protein [Mycena venus]
MEVDAASANGPHRIQELWFEDGNLVIQAGNKQYRVYRGVLAMHSPVFQDMFSFPQPPGSHLVEGCPLVNLPDSEVEVTSFLRAIFDSSFFMSFPAPTQFDIVVGVLRLSHKYGVDYLRRRALVHLSSAYQTTLSECDDSSYYGDESDPSCPASLIRSWEWPDDPAYYLVSVHLAREVDAPWILPYAFYCLASAYPRKLGVAVYHGAVYNGVSITLSMQDQQTLVLGHTKQNASSAVDILRFLSYPPKLKGCASPEKCFSERLQAMENNRENLRLSCGHPLGLWDDDEWEWLENLCPACLAALKKTHENARQAFWDELPEIYALPSWEELENLKVAAIGTNLFC